MENDNPFRRRSFFHRSWLSEGVKGTGFAFGIGEVGIERDSSSPLKFKWQRGIVLEAGTKKQGLQDPREVPVNGEKNSKLRT